MDQSKYDKATEAINEVFSDTSVEPEETVRNLRSLKDEIDVMIDSI